MADTTPESPRGNPLEILFTAQQKAVRIAAGTARTVASTAVTGVTRPDQLAAEVVGTLSGQVSELADTVAGMAGSLTGVVGATAQPLQDFVVRQRELADTVARIAQAQAELAALIATLADRHAEVVATLESLTTPVLGLLGAERTVS